MSDERIEISKAEIVDVPSGVEAIGYGAYDLDDTEGLPLLVKEGSRFTPKFRELTDHSKGGFTIRPKEMSEIFYVAHLRVTGTVHENATRCRFEYSQGGATYTQTLRCGLKLRLKK